MAMETFTSKTGVSITYEVMGEGPLMAFVHGGGADARAWKPIKKFLPPNYRVLCPNRLGYGGSGARQRRDEPDHWEDGEPISELLGGEAGSIILCGHSSGGYVALEIALKSNLPISHLVLFEPAVPALLRDVGDDAMYQWTVHHFIDGAATKARRGDPVGVEMMVDGWNGDGAYHRLPDPVKSHLQNFAEALAEDIQAGFVNTYDLRRLAETHIPTLVVTGDAGKKLASTMARHLAACLPDCDHHLIEGADHGLITTHAELCAELLVGFLTRT